MHDAAQASFAAPTSSFYPPKFEIKIGRNFSQFSAEIPQFLTQVFFFVHFLGFFPI